MPTIYVDGKAHEIEDGQNLLEACTKLGYDLPYFCWHPALGSVGACRQCAVKVFKDENDTRGRIVMACMTPASDGTRLSIKDLDAKEMRQEVIDWLMVNHPHDCPVCDEGGECQLQDMTVMSGHNYREFRFEKRTFRNQDLGPFVYHEMNRCIQCYRCVRFYDGIAGGRDLSAQGCHDHTYFGREEDGTLESPFAGNLVEVCPTGVFTDKTLRRHYTRKWDLTTAPSVCAHCGVGCNVTPGERYGSLRRIRNRYHPEVNGWFLCDRGRFGYEFVNRDDRLKAPAAGGEALDEEQLATRLAALKGRKIAGIGSPRASLEGNFALRRLVGGDQFFAGLPAHDLDLLDIAVRVMREGPVPVATLQQVEEEVDAVLVLGEDVWNGAPRLALSLRQAARNAPLAREAARLRIPHWDDSALREVLQDETGPFFVATPGTTELDSVATRTFRGAPADIARLGCAVAHALDPEAPGADLGREHTDLAGQIAAALRDAKHPLVVSGTGLGSRAVLEAAANVAWALHRQGHPARLSLVVPEANSIGLALLGGRSLEDATAQVEAGKIDVLVVLENDLYRRAPAETVDALLDKVDTVVVLDHLRTATTDKASLVLPAGTFAETAGTFVSSEGRAQRFFSAFEPQQWVRSGWRWVARLAATTGRDDLDWTGLDEVVADLVEERPDLAGVGPSAKHAGWRKHGLKVPRQGHRYSGRTSMRAHLSMHEPKPPDDPDSALSFSMEGTKDLVPGSLRSFEWAPGWNSEQSVNRLMAEARQQGVNEAAGVRLLEPPAAPTKGWLGEIPVPFEARPGRYLVLEAQRVFGSEELSARAEGLSQRVPDPFIEIGRGDAADLGATDGDEVQVRLGERALRLSVLVDEQLPRGVVLLPRDLPGLREAWGVPLPGWAEITRLGGAA